MMQVPKKLLDKGVRDIARVSDARMSGTHFGTVILHVSPEAAIGGPLALVHDGDWIEIDVERRLLTLDVPLAELGIRREQWTAPTCRHARGWARIYTDHVEQADLGADFDVLGAGADTPEPEIN
jgi:dihydroxy-acid dehydratase